MPRINCWHGSKALRRLRGGRAVRLLAAVKLQTLFELSDSGEVAGLQQQLLGQGRDLHSAAKVRDFCVGNEIEPAVQCMASLISSFKAQVL